MCADLGDWQAPESLRQRIGGFIDREWPATGWIVALFLTVAIAVGVSV